MAPPSALISYGFQARVMYVEPESELVVVTMGQTEGNSLWDGGCSYDEGYTITLMVHAWQNATTPDPALKHAYDAAAARRAADSAEIAAAGRVGEWVLERHGERSSTAAARTTVARPPSSRPAQLGNPTDWVVLLLLPTGRRLRHVCQRLRQQHTLRPEQAARTAPTPD